MTQPAAADQQPDGPTSLRLPRGISGLLLFAPFMIAAGAFITIAMRPFTTTVGGRSGDAILMAWVGMVLLCLGAVFLTVGLVAVSVRSMLRRQTDLLLQGKGDGAA